MGKKLGNLIRSARTDAGLTQAQLAQKIAGESASEIGRYERGEAEPTTQVVKEIAKATGVTQKSLLDAMPKRTTQSSTSTSSSSSSGSTMKVSTTERKLVELYRKADTDTKKRAMQVLKGESNDMTDLLGTVGGIIGEALLSR